MLPRTNQPAATKMSSRISALLMLATLLVSVQASSILMLIPMGSHSHKNVYIPLAQKMGQKGHDVTMVSLYETSSMSVKGSKAFTDVIAASTRKYVKNITGEMNVFNMMEKDQDPSKVMFRKIITNIPQFCDAFIRDPALRKVWQKKPDLIILPPLMNDCGLIFVQKFKVPFIYMSTHRLTSWTADSMGNSENPAFIPNALSRFTTHMNFGQRLLNTLIGILAPSARNHFILNRLDDIAQQFLGDDSISLNKIDQSVALTLVNSHHTLTSTQPLVPSIVEVGGMHCRPGRNIQNQDIELKKFLDEAGTKKAVLVSLGSIMKSSQMPAQIIQKFVEAFQKLPYRIVWKFEGEKPANLSSNILIREWLPQQDVLAHPAIGAFFSHAGMLSLQETVYHGVPMVAHPLISDQHQNANIVVEKGIGLQVDYKKLTTEEIISSIKKVVETPSFHAASRRLSLLFKDRETKPVDRAVYWSEYIIKHNGAPHLKSPATKLNFVQYHLLDVIFVSIILFSFIICSLYFILKLVMSSLLSHTGKNLVSLIHMKKLRMIGNY